ncbi:hypothetical protein ABZ674_37390, partial [Streptomyces massasporeus]
MDRDDMILISVDDHIIEPPDLFANHLPARYKKDAPRLVHREDGSDVWQFRDAKIGNAALNAVAGRPKEEYGMEPQGLDEIRPGCYDVDERVSPSAQPAVESAAGCAASPLRDAVSAAGRR